MELFSEVYSCYYQAVEKILQEAESKPITQASISKIIDETAFLESGLTILPKLMQGDWPLLEQKENGWQSKVGHLPELPLTALQKAWIKALLQDQRIQLFFTEEQMKSLKALLAEVTPLFSFDSFYNFDIFLDGDPYEDTSYQENFRKILYALQKKQILFFAFMGSKGNFTQGDYLPCKLEYSKKNDKFRLYAAKIQGQKYIAMQTINLGRIVEIKASREFYTKEIDMHQYFIKHRCADPLQLKIFPKRNALERCMLHFASYEKRTEYDGKMDVYFCTIYYDKQDETELLIRVLSFGPVVQVLGPASFLKQMKERIKRQYLLLHKEEIADEGQNST